MKNPLAFLAEYLTRLKTNGGLAVCYALLAEALFIGYLAFATLFTIEMLLPLFITAHLSLAKFFFFLLFFSFVLAILGQVLDLSFQWNIHKKNPLVWIGLLWYIGILALSLYNFPPILIPVIIIAFLLVGYLFWNIFFGKEE